MDKKIQELTNSVENKTVNDLLNLFNCKQKQKNDNKESSLDSRSIVNSKDDFNSKGSLDGKQIGSDILNNNSIFTNLTSSNQISNKNISNKNISNKDLQNNIKLNNKTTLTKNNPQEIIEQDIYQPPNFQLHDNNSFVIFKDDDIVFTFDGVTLFFDCTYSNYSIVKSIRDGCFYSKGTVESINRDVNDVVNRDINNIVSRDVNDVVSRDVNDVVSGVESLSLKGCGDSKTSMDIKSSIDIKDSKNIENSNSHIENSKESSFIKETSYESSLNKNTSTLIPKTYFVYLDTQNKLNYCTIKNRISTDNTILNSTSTDNTISNTTQSNISSTYKSHSYKTLSDSKFLISRNVIQILKYKTDIYYLSFKKDAFFLNIINEDKNILKPKVLVHNLVSKYSMKLFMANDLPFLFQDNLIINTNLKRINVKGEGIYELSGYYVILRVDKHQVGFSMCDEKFLIKSEIGIDYSKGDRMECDSGMECERRIDIGVVGDKRVDGAEKLMNGSERRLDGVEKLMNGEKTEDVNKCSIKDKEIERNLISSIDKNSNRDINKSTTTLNSINSTKTTSNSTKTNSIKTSTKTKPHVEIKSHPEVLGVKINNCIYLIKVENKELKIIKEIKCSKYCVNFNVRVDGNRITVVKLIRCDKREDDFISGERSIVNEGVYSIGERGVNSIVSEDIKDEGVNSIGEKDIKNDISKTIGEKDIKNEGIVNEGINSIGEKIIENSFTTLGETFSKKDLPMKNFKMNLTVKKDLSKEKSTKENDNSTIRDINTLENSTIGNFKTVENTNIVKEYISKWKLPINGVQIKDLHKECVITKEAPSSTGENCTMETLLNGEKVAFDKDNHNIDIVFKNKDGVNFKFKNTPLCASEVANGAFSNSKNTLNGASSNGTSSYSKNTLNEVSSNNISLNSKSTTNDINSKNTLNGASSNGTIPYSKNTLNGASSNETISYSKNTSNKIPSNKTIPLDIKNTPNEIPSNKTIPHNITNDSFNIPTLMEQIEKIITKRFNQFEKKLEENEIKERKKQLTLLDKISDTLNSTLLSVIEKIVRNEIQTLQQKILKSINEGRTSNGNISEGRIIEGRTSNINEGRTSNINEGRIIEGRTSNGNISEGRIIEGRTSNINEEKILQFTKDIICETLLPVIEASMDEMRIQMISEISSINNISYLKDLKRAVYELSIKKDTVESLIKSGDHEKLINLVINSTGGESCGGIISGGDSYGGRDSYSGGDTINGRDTISGTTKDITIHSTTKDSIHTIHPTNPTTKEIEEFKKLYTPNLLCHVSSKSLITLFEKLKSIDDVEHILIDILHFIEIDNLNEEELRHFSFIIEQFKSYKRFEGMSMLIRYIGSRIKKKMECIN